MFLCVNNLKHFNGPMNIEKYNKYRVLFKYVIIIDSSELVSLGSLLAND